jgi:chromate transport protein ChrA
VAGGPIGQVCYEYKIIIIDDYFIIITIYVLNIFAELIYLVFVITGALMGGLGFITPGFCLVLLFSWFYEQYGIQNSVFVSIMLGLQPASAAMICRASHKIYEMSVTDHKTKKMKDGLVIVAVLSAFLTVLNVNYFISKLHLFFAYYAFKRKASSTWWAFWAYFWLVLLMICHQS